VNKQALVAQLARRLAVPKSRAAEIVDTVFAADGIIASELKRGGRVRIAGFGDFELRPRAARRAVHPRTGKAIAVKASSVPAFRAGKALKELVNRKR
jgi:DNA-binding protein HU-beta